MTSSVLALRRARQTDAGDLRLIMHDTFAGTWLPNITAAAAEEFSRTDRPRDYVAARWRNFWVAERDGAIIGFVDRDDDYVSGLHVHSASARSGAGRALMNKAEAEAKADGFDVLRLETDTFNVASQALYAALGYQEIDRYDDVEWNSGFTTVMLAKSLHAPS